MGNSALAPLDVDDRLDELVKGSLAGHAGVSFIKDLLKEVVVGRGSD